MIKDLSALIQRAEALVNDKNTKTEIREAISGLFDFQPKFIPDESRWVDLGLPSGNLWYKSNGDVNGEQYFTHEEALEAFGEYLPSATAMAELYENCEWKWAGDGCRVTGPNGNYIFLPACGEKDTKDIRLGFYWTRCVDKISQTYARSLSFSSGSVYPLSLSSRSNGFSVRPCREL